MTKQSDSDGFGRTFVEKTSYANVGSVFVVSFNSRGEQKSFFEGSFLLKMQIIPYHYIALYPYKTFNC